MDKEFSLYKEMLDNMYEGIYFVDTNRKITFWNKEAERISGFKANEIIGKYCYDNVLNHVDENNNQLCKDGCPLHKTSIDGQQREAGVYLHHKDGHRVAVAIRTIPLFIEGEIIGAVEVFIDDSKQVEINRTINELKTFALYDQLTELPNRRYIDSFLSNRLREFEELEIPFALVMMDIDHFRNFNDTYGHDVGDMVLKMVAKTFKSAFRKGDLIGRWGGEEFLAILPGVSEGELETISEKVRSLVEKSILRSEKQPLNVTVSIGSTLVHKDDTAIGIQKRADNALYKSKENGRNMVTIL